MKLFRLSKTDLNEVEQIPFKLEKNIQDLVEKNTESVFNLKFIQSVEDKFIEHKDEILTMKNV
jgi:hypothetical protein